MRKSQIADKATFAAMQGYIDTLREHRHEMSTIDKASALAGLGEALDEMPASHIELFSGMIDAMFTIMVDNVSCIIQELKEK